MVPKVELPLTMPFTVQVTAVLVVPVMDAVKVVAELVIRLAGLVGVVMEIPTAAETVTLKVAVLLTSALLAMTRLNVAGVGTEDGAV